MSRWQFGVHPSVSHGKAMIRNLEKNTGRALGDWVALLNGRGPSGASDPLTWLKEEHDLGKITAQIVVDHASQRLEGYDDASYLASAQAHVDAMFAGPKSALLPLYERLMDLAYALGPDLRACPCKTMVPLYRHHAIAEIKPTTRTRIDFGLALRPYAGKLPPRLLETAGLRDTNRITHRLSVSTLADIDDELAHWLKVAYNDDAP